jgi:hypothetical protein
VVRGAGRGRWAAVDLAASVGLVLVTGLLGPSAAQPPLPGTFPLPLQLSLDPSPLLVTGLLLAAIGFGVAGLVQGLRAIAVGWQLDLPRVLALAGLATAAMVVVPPMGSADVLVYAAYGRITALGEDPYTTTANDLAATADPIGRAVEPPWQDTPSIYGPMATGEQWLASWLGGDSPQETVWWLAVFTAACYVVTGLLLLRLAVGGAARSRVVLLWWLNPLLLYGVVNGAHLDGVGIAFAVGALMAVRRSPVVAGLLAGAAVAVKLSFGLYALALAWALRRSPRRLFQLAAAALVVLAAAYATVGLHAFDQARSASRLVSFAMPARLLVGPLESVLPNAVARDLVAAVGWVAFAALAAWLAIATRAPASRPTAGGGQPFEPAGVRDIEHGPESTGFDMDPLPDAVRAAAVLGFAWLLTATYSLPWYDVVAWAPFALLAASAYDWLLIGRTALLAVAYVPGRVVELPDALDALTRNLRGTLGPLGGVALVVLAVILAMRQRSPAVGRLVRD